MSKPRVSKKQLEAFLELRDKLKKHRGEYRAAYDKCPLCIANLDGCKKCICFLFATKEELDDRTDIYCMAYFPVRCDVSLVRAAYQKLKRRMQRAGIKVLT